MYLSILQKPDNKRSHKDLVKLFEIISKVNFFFQFSVNSFEKFRPILNRLRHSFFKEQEYIMRRGDLGDKFYIILQGVVNIWIPAKNEEILLEDGERLKL